MIPTERKKEFVFETEDGREFVAKRQFMNYGYNYDRYLVRDADGNVVAKFEVPQS